MNALRSTFRPRGTLARLYSGRDNGIGLLRLVLALAVVASHSRPLGFAQPDLGLYLFRRQTHVGWLAVCGFFVLSGLLITRSARRSSLPRYAFHRALRILPALWVCLFVSAFVVAPLMTVRERGSLAGFWRGPAGPVNYFTANMWTGLRQFGVHDLLVHTTPYGRKTGNSVFDGALWSLSYEMLCYIVIGVLAVTAVLRSARRFVLFLCVASYAVIVIDFFQSTVVGPTAGRYGSFSLPLLGHFSTQWAVYLGFLFLAGATMEMYREKIPIIDAAGVVAALVFVATLRFGGFYPLGFPAFAYLLIWLSLRIPRRLHWVGRKNDYSYGIYIYGFAGQQVLASLGMNRWGIVPFALFAFAVAFAAAFLSWHLVERHALALKQWTPSWPPTALQRPAAGLLAGVQARDGDPDRRRTGTSGIVRPSQDASSQDTPGQTGGSPTEIPHTPMAPARSQP